MNFVSKIFDNQIVIIPKINFLKNLMNYCNIKDYKNSSIEVLSAEHFLKTI